MRFLSIKKIAKEAGVSTATVSRVLNNPGYKCSSEELRERIWKIARELNYMPNEAARNLKKGITDTSQKVWYLDVLMTRTGNLETDPFFSELLRVIESEIHRQGCILMHIFHQPAFWFDSGESIRLVGSRLTHGLAPQQADAEPVHCFIATDSWSTPLSSKGIIYHSCGIARQNWFTYNKTLDTSGLYWMGDSVLFFTQLWLWYHLKDQPHPPREKRKTGLIL